MAAPGSLASHYDSALLDLDGTVYEGGRPVPGALEALRDAGLPMKFITNNASRSPVAVSDQLVGMGYDCVPDDVLTSAQVGVSLLAETVEPGAKVLVLGADSFRELVTDGGYVVVDSADDAPAAVIQGHNPQTGWAQLSEAALAIQRGATYVASNLDTTLPMERGFLVGNGSMVAAVVSATGVTPLSAGKPEPAMFHVAAKAAGSERPLAIGDRLNTDIRGGNNAGMDTLMVVTGVSGHRDALTAVPEERPSLIGADMSALQAPAEQSAPGAQAGFTASLEGTTLTLSGGEADLAPAQAAVAALLTAAEIVWAAYPDSAADDIEIVAASPQAQSALDNWR